MSGQPAGKVRELPPQIQVTNRQESEVLEDARKLLEDTNDPPHLFLRSGDLVTVERTEKGASIKPLSFRDVRVRLLARADWIKAVKRDGDYKPCPALLPKDLPKDLLVAPPVVPLLEGVIEAPTVLPSGEIVLNYGYHETARLWYEAPDTLDLPAIPECPTKEEVAAARSLIIDELLVDFPFQEQSDRAHAVAALLLHFCRRIIDGPTPLHLAEASTPGSGKGLLADAVSLLALGREAEPSVIGKDEEATRKKLFSALLRGSPIILLDNIRDGIDSAALAAVLTSRVFTDRILGLSKDGTAPNEAVWLATANNPSLSLEIARRVLRIRIHPQTERPWERTGFKHDPLREWLRWNRGKLIGALLTLIRAWVSAGRPPGDITLGSFEAWSRTVGGILDVVGIPGFLEGRDQFYREADREGDEWRAFVERWWRELSLWDRLATRSAPASELRLMAIRDELLLSVLGDKSERSQTIRLGNALQAKRGCIIEIEVDGEHLPLAVKVARDDHRKASTYHLVRLLAGREDPAGAEQIPQGGGPGAGSRGITDMPEMPGPAGSPASCGISGPGSRTRSCGVNSSQGSGLATGAGSCGITITPLSKTRARARGQEPDLEPFRDIPQELEEEYAREERLAIQEEGAASAGEDKA